MPLAAGCVIEVYDPAAMERAQERLSPAPSLGCAASIDDAARGADALLILTDWPEFARLDLPRLRKLMHFPVIVDGRNLYNPQTMLAQHFTYLSVGRATVVPAHGSTPIEACHKLFRAAENAFG